MGQSVWSVDQTMWPATFFLCIVTSSLPSSAARALFEGNIVPWFDFDDFIVGDAPTLSKSKLQPTQPTLGKLKVTKTSKAPTSFTTTTASSLIKDIEEENDIVVESSTKLVSEDLTSTTTIKAPTLLNITKEDVQEAFMEIDPGTTKITTVSVEEGRKPVMPSIAEDQMMMDQMMMDKMMLESLHSSHNKRVRPDKERKFEKKAGEKRQGGFKKILNSFKNIF